MKILTQRSKIPWLWTLIMAFPGGVESLMESVSGLAVTYTLWKFTQDPALIAFIGSLNVAFNFLVAPLAAWHSDRIWTRWGRRVPFMIVGLTLAILSLIFIPLAPSLWVLLVVLALFYASVDLGFTGPWAPLYFETIPPAQRGRAVILKRLAMTCAQLLFNLILIGQFDKTYRIRLSGAAGGFAVTGEQVVYGVAALMLLAALITVVLFVREQKPAQLSAERFNPKSYFKTLFGMRRRWPLYLLAFSSVAMAVSLGQLQPLLITQQFGYSKQALGGIISTVMMLEIFVILPVMALLVDRVSRLRLYQVTIALSALFPFLFWLFIRFAAPNHIPGVGYIMTFMTCHMLVRAAASLCIEPLFFDNLHPDEMGTAQSGLLMVRGVLSVLVMNGIGWWVKIYSWVFPPEGRMKIDYSSAYLYISGMGIIALIASFIYASRILGCDQKPAGSSSQSGAEARPQHPHLGAMGGSCCRMK